MLDVRLQCTAGGGVAVGNGLLLVSGAGLDGAYCP